MGYTEKIEKLHKKMLEFSEIMLCPYEDDKLAFFMKLIFGFIWAVSIPYGLISGAPAAYLAVLAGMSLVLLINFSISRIHRAGWIDALTFISLWFPVAYIFCDASVGYLSILFLLLYGCGMIFILGIRNSMPINIGFLLLIMICFRWDEDSLVKLRYGENIAMRFPYLYICVVLIVYCLMYRIQRYWVQKNKRTQILEQCIREERQKLDEMSMKVMNTMVQALGAKIPGKEEHCRRVAEYARKIAFCKGMDEQMCTEAYNAGLLHEIGMIGIPDALIQRNNLTEEEYGIYKTYVEKGYQIISTMQSEDMYRVAEAVRYHREGYDGRGFLKGLSGDEIPELARIIAVADYTDRHLKYGESRETVIEALLAQENVAFEAEAVKIMVMILKG